MSTSTSTVVTSSIVASNAIVTSGTPTVTVALTPASVLAQPTPAVAGTGTVTLPVINAVPNSCTSVSISSPVVSQSVVNSVLKVTDRLVLGTDNSQVLNKQRLQDLVREVDPNEQLDDDVEELLLQIADDFIENVVTTSCLLAKHRKSSTLEVKDVQLSLEKNWNMWIPGFGAEEVRPYKKSSTTEAHKQRMALIRKTLKKY